MIEHCECVVVRLSKLWLIFRGFNSTMRVHKLQKVFVLFALVSVFVVSSLHVSAQSNGLGITPKLSYTHRGWALSIATLYM